MILGVIDTGAKCIVFDINEIAQALLYHYAVLVSEGKGKIGIVTRPDFLRLLIRK